MIRGKNATQDELLMPGAWTLSGSVEETEKMVDFQFHDQEVEEHSRSARDRNQAPIHKASSSNTAEVMYLQLVKENFRMVVHTRATSHGCSTGQKSIENSRDPVWRYQDQRKLKASSTLRSSPLLLKPKSPERKTFSPAMPRKRLLGQ